MECCLFLVYFLIARRLADVRVHGQAMPTLGLILVDIAPQAIAPLISFSDGQALVGVYIYTSHILNHMHLYV